MSERVEPDRQPQSPEERSRRAEAIRRAAEELAARGVKTDGHLINLIEEEGIYKVAFVKHSRGKLRRQVSVRVRREDFEILEIEGIGSRGGEGERDAGSR